MVYRLFVVWAILARVAVLPAMSHTKTMDHDAAQGQLRLMMSAASKPLRPKQHAVIGSRQNIIFGIVVAQGRVVYDYALMMMGEEAMSKVLRNEKKLKLSRGFWPAS